MTQRVFFLMCIVVALQAGYCNATIIRYDGDAAIAKIKLLAHHATPCKNNIKWNSTYYDDPIVMSASGSMGSKIAFAHQIGIYTTIGIDLIAQSVNDLLVHGIEPLFFFHYFTEGVFDSVSMQQIIDGVMHGCIYIDSAFINDEPIQLSGVYDVAGCAVGIVERDLLLPKKTAIEVGDVCIGLTSSGLHANGFSLVRHIINEHAIDLHAPPPFDSPHAHLYDELLVPTKMYVREVLPLMQQGYIKAAAHITDGGLLESIPPVLPLHLVASLARGAWPVPPVFAWLADSGSIDERDMLCTFNCGIGFVLIVKPDLVDEVMYELLSRGQDAYVIGTIGWRESEDESVIVR